MRQTNVLVVGELRDAPTEGAQVITSALVAKLTETQSVAVLEPAKLLSWLPRTLVRPAKHIVFTHGPGIGVVAISILLRRLTPINITWVATRPDLVGLPRWLEGWRTAHAIVCNVPRAELKAASRDAKIIQQFIGIDPERLSDQSPGSQGNDMMRVARARGKKIVLHVGHLRQNRGLHQLAEAKERLGDSVEFFVQGSPNFPSDPSVLETLTKAGVHVLTGTVTDLRQLYRSADVYVFPTRPCDGGAIDLPLSILEAVASGVPVVATDFGAISPALGGVPGVHIAAPNHFVDLLEQVLTDPQRLSEVPPGLPDQLHIDALVNRVLDGITDTYEA